jgi:hypothetical protein
VDEAQPDIRALTPLLGTWTGTGQANFPTIAAFEYREELRFELDPQRPLIHYEQRATHRELGATSWSASHWESGFLRPVEAGAIEMTNAQDGGRLEILRFTVSLLPQGLRLVGHSTHLINDPRLVRTQRDIEVRGDELSYTVSMQTTRVSEVLVHLRARLVRNP